MTKQQIPRQTTPRAATILLWIASLLVACSSVSAQMGKQESELPLFATSVVHCDEMIALHRWEGSCCSLNVTQGNGCVLNVMDGYCKVTGQYWTLDFNSTYGTPCPPSEYSNDQLDNPWKPPAEESSGRSSFGSLHTTTTTTAVLLGLATIAWLLE